MVFFTAEERRGDIFMNTLNMSLGSGSVASSELIFWSGVLRGHYQEFSPCAFSVKAFSILIMQLFLLLLLVNYGASTHVGQRLHVHSAM